MRSGEDDGGGVRWVEDGTSRNTCSTASAAWLALRLDDRAFAARAMDWLDVTLRIGEGLYRDRIDEGRIDPTIWSYNQGASMAALGLLGRRDAAETTAAASLRLFTGDRLWREPPPFLAIWFRALLGDPACRREAADLLAAHTDRLLAEALDPATGLFTAGGVGSYDGSTDDRSGRDRAAARDALARRGLSAGVSKNRPDTLDDLRLRKNLLASGKPRAGLTAVCCSTWDLLRGGHSRETHRGVPQSWTQAVTKRQTPIHLPLSGRISRVVRTAYLILHDRQGAEEWHSRRSPSSSCTGRRCPDMTCRSLGPSSRDPPRDTNSPPRSRPGILHQQWRRRSRPRHRTSIWCAP